MHGNQGKGEGRVEWRQGRGRGEWRQGRVWEVGMLGLGHFEMSLLKVTKGLPWWFTG